MNNAQQEMALEATGNMRREAPDSAVSAQRDEAQQAEKKIPV
jgi:hypothetical protein